MSGEETTEAILRPEFPVGRVKRIVKLDKDINKVTSEALFLISSSTELFLRFITEKSAEIATEKKRKVVKLDHIRAAVKRHRPTSDFLLDSLPVSTQISEKPAAEKPRHRSVDNNPGTRRIDDFFAKSTSEAPVQINDS
ncbi:nuclear factor Y subunit C13 [Euphorbia peplus]|nr:nuclear factor Y subunit C13 [Euphorbia peplus]